MTTYEYIGFARWVDICTVSFFPGAQALLGAVVNDTKEAAD
jgi:hypothetical protein